MLIPTPRTQKKHATQVPVPSNELGPKSLAVGQIFAEKFKLIEKVGQGSFGSIFKTENTETGEICATKFEKREQSKSAVSLLVREIKVLLEVKKIRGFPHLVYYGRDEQFNYFMLSYLGFNLEILLRKCKSFSQLTCLKISLQLLERIQDLHSKNLLHRDLKPENICIGWQDIDVIYLIDFGLSKYFIDSNAKHISMSEKKGMIGTARYASISAHLGKEQSRKDDLESLAYVLIYLCKAKLPWMNINLPDKAQKYQKILEQKQSIPPEKLCENLPKCYYSLLQYSKSRDFQEEPNYEYLKEQFVKAIFEKEQSEQFQGYEWEKLPDIQRKRKDKLQTKPISRTPDKKPSFLVQDRIIAGNSFLNVPHDDGDLEKKSRGVKQFLIQYVSHHSIGTTRMLNYNISQLCGIEGEEYKKYVSQISAKKRKDVKSVTQMISDVRNFKEQPIIKQQVMVDVDYAYTSFDDLDQIADDETNIQFQNISVLQRKN